MWAEYKAFLFRGNLIDLAVAFILGVAFSAVVTSFTDGILMNLIAALFGLPNFDEVVWTVNGGRIEIGGFLTAVVSFLIVATVLFVIVRAAARFDRPAPEPQGPAPDTDEVVVLREIRVALLAGRTP
jgi:large conductance mechanosensitive channel